GLEQSSRVRAEAVVRALRVQAAMLERFQGADRVVLTIDVSDSHIEQSRLVATRCEFRHLPWAIEDCFSMTHADLERINRDGIVVSDRRVDGRLIDGPLVLWGEV